MLITIIGRLPSVRVSLLFRMDGGKEKKHLLQTASVTRDPFTPKLVRTFVDMCLSEESPEGEAQDSLPKGGRLSI